MLANLQTLVPDARLVLEAETSRVIAFATSADQALIESAVEKLTGGDTPETTALTESPASLRTRLNRALRRRLERMREPDTFHEIDPRPPLGYPEAESAAELRKPDVQRRGERRRDLTRRLRQLRRK